MGGATLTVGSDVTLLNFSLTITPQTTTSAVVAVWAPIGVTGFKAVGLRLNLLQSEVSNGFPPPLAIQKGTRVLISLWDSLMFGRRVPKHSAALLGTLQNISDIAT